MSPLPPLARAGAPTALTAQCSPSTVIRVRAPLRITAQPQRRCSACRASSGCPVTQGMSWPSRRAASPGCGVTMSWGFRGSRDAASPWSASRFRASASQTTGHSVSRKARRMGSSVSSWPRPGPMAARLASRRTLRTMSAASGRRRPLPPSVSASGSSTQVAPGQRVCTTGSTCRLHSTVVRPAPARTQAMAHRAAAPAMPVLPAKRTDRPKTPLWASAARSGIRGARSFSSRTERPFTAPQSAGMRIGATVTRPAQTQPWRRYRPGFGRWKVTVSAARTAPPTPPSSSPVAPFSPEGISTATTGRPERFTSPMSCLATPSTGRDSPVPNRASTTASKEAGHSDCAVSSSRSRRIGMPACRARKRSVPASP